MCTPCGRAETLDRSLPRLRGLQAWGRRPNTHSTPPEPITEPNNQQTQPKNCPGRVRARARPNDLPPMPRLSLEDHSPPVGHLMTPHRCPHCEIGPDDVFPLPLIQLAIPIPHPIMKICSPQL